MQKPDLLIESEIKLDNDDFPQRFHKIVFNVIKQLYTDGVDKITPVTIDHYLASYKEQYKVFEKNNGLEYLEEAIDLSNIDTFEYNVKRIKKFSLLRDLQKEKFDISEIYDANNEEKQKKFDQMELEDIINYYNKKLIDIERKLVNTESGTHISTGIDELLNELETSPIMGYNAGINALNYYLYGLRRKYYLFSARTGVGKTKMQTYLTLQLGYHQNVSTLFISTEMPKDEIQTSMIAYIADVNERKILTNQLSFEEKEKILEAKEKLKNSNIHIVYVPDFDLEKIEYIIKRYIISKKIEFCVFDYIKESISMIEGITKKVGKIDGWKALNLFSERMKMYVEKYGIGIISATQLNKAGDTSGSAAIPNAVDVWNILRYADKDEKTKLGLEFGEANENEQIMVIENFKNRRGVKGFNVYLKVDLGRLQFNELLVTKNDNPIKIPIVEFQQVEDIEKKVKQIKENNDEEKLCWEQ